MLKSLHKINLDNFKGILIDIDDTMYNYDVCHKHALDKCFKFYKKNISSKCSYLSFKLQYRKCRTIITKELYPSGSCRSRLLAFHKMLENNSVDTAWIYCKKLSDIYWDSFIKKIKIDMSIKKLLLMCKKRSIPVCAITDMLSSTQVEKLIKMKAERLISHLVTSEEVGVEKPHKKIFLLALKKINCRPKEVLMIGDSIKKDINGAEKLGITSLMYKAK